MNSQVVVTGHIQLLLELNWKNYAVYVEYEMVNTTKLKMQLFNIVT